jgi:addiction module RelE/StbE family toxin
MRVVFLPRAANDLDEIGQYIAAIDQQAATGQVQRILDHCSNLKLYPLMGRSGRVAETRELVVPGTRFVVVYRVHKEQVQILAIFHAARDWPEGF